MRNHEIKTTDEVRALIGNMSMNEYRGHTEEEANPRKKGMIDLNTQDALLARNKLLNIQLKTIAKRLEAREVAQLSAKANCDICEQAHESGVCIPTSFGFSEEQVKYMGNYSRQKRNPYSNTYNPGWAEHPNFSYRSNNILQPPRTTPPKELSNNHQGHLIMQIIHKGKLIDWLRRLMKCKSDMRFA